MGWIGVYINIYIFSNIESCQLLIRFRDGNVAVQCTLGQFIIVTLSMVTVTIANAHWVAIYSFSLES